MQKFIQIDNETIINLDNVFEIQLNENIAQVFFVSPNGSVAGKRFRGDRRYDDAKEFFEELKNTLNNN